MLQRSSNVTGYKHVAMDKSPNPHPHPHPNPNQVQARGHGQEQAAAIPGQDVAQRKAGQSSVVASNR